MLAMFMYGAVAAKVKLNHFVIILILIQAFSQSNFLLSSAKKSIFAAANKLPNSPFAMLPVYAYKKAW